MIVATDDLPALDLARAIALRLALGGASSGPSPAAPDWLRPEQHRPFARVVTALSRHGGVMLALPVGAGKSFIALAAGAATGHAAVAVVGPSLLEPQWRALGRRLGIALTFTSFDLLSRGRGAPGPGLVIIDESHRLSQPGTRRYRQLAPLLADRAVILLTATPIVNRPSDLAAQLALALPDDALAAAGLPSIAGGLGGAGLPPALDQVVIGGAPPAAVPARREVLVEWGPDDPHLEPALGLIDRLRLSASRPIGALIRTSLLRAVASGPAALLESVRRYRRLLDHAGRARRAGHSVNRALIRGVIDPAPDQLVLWELLDPVRITGDLALGDRPLLERLDALVVRWQTAGDAKGARLRALLEDRALAVVFCSSVATVHHLRRVLGAGATAWLTGGGAGAAWHRLPRSQVVRWFGPDRVEQPGLPRILVASDVAAEGLDLQGASRLVHFDLPWTAVRVDQRDGRIIRLGSGHAEAEIIRFAVPASVEARLGIEAAVAAKRRTAGGLLDGIRAGTGPDHGVTGWAQYESAGGEDGFAARVQFDRGGRAASDWLVSYRSTSGWSDDPGTVRGLIDELGRPIEADPAAIASVLERLAPVIAERIRRLNGSLLGLGRRGPGRIGARDGFISARVQAVLIFKPAPRPATLS